MSDRIFFFFFLKEGGGGRRGLSRVGVVTVETMSNHTVIIHQGQDTFFSAAKQHFWYCLRCLCLSILPLICAGCQRWRLLIALDTAVLVSTLPRNRRVRPRGQENKVGDAGPHLREDAAAPVWPCCFVPPQCTEIAQINLLFAWLGQHVCVFFFFCACVCSWSQLSHFPLRFNRIECSGVTTEECLGDCQHQRFSFL